jgi:hypothetical protein
VFASQTDLTKQRLLCLARSSLSCYRPTSGPGRTDATGTHMAKWAVRASSGVQVPQRCGRRPNPRGAMALHGRDDQEAAAAAILLDVPGANGPAYGITGNGESPVKKRINTNASPIKAVSSGTNTVPRLHDHHPKPPLPPPPTPSLHGTAACALVHPPPTLQRSF